MSYPPALQEIVDFFEPLAEAERREALWAFAAQAHLHQPRPDEHYDLVDERRDASCLDTVGVYLRLGERSGALYRLRLGSEVQTLTRAMGVILCRGLHGLQTAEIVTICDNFVPAIAGAELMRLRSRSVYYMWQRMKEAAAACDS